MGFSNNEGGTPRNDEEPGCRAEKSWGGSAATANSDSLGFVSLLLAAALPLSRRRLWVLVLRRESDRIPSLEFLRRGRPACRSFPSSSSGCLSGNQSVNLLEDGFECRPDIAIRERRGLNEEQFVLLAKLLRFVCLHLTHVAQIFLVAYEHDDNILVGVVTQFFQPARNVVIGSSLGDIVDQQGSHGAAIVGGSDGAVALLAGCIPDLSLGEDNTKHAQG